MNPTAKGTFWFILLLAGFMVLAPGMLMAQDGSMDQSQYANQGQTQYSVAAPSTSVAVSPSQANSQNMSLVFEAGEDSTVTYAGEVSYRGHGYRGFAVPGDVYYPPLIGYTGQVPDFGPQCQTISQILLYKNTFHMIELENMLSQAKNGKKIFVRPISPAPETLSDKITVFVRKPQIEAKLLGFITVAAKNTKSLSVDIMAKAALAARDMGANAIHVSAEGTQRKLKSFGWGIGFNYTQATLNSNEDRSGIGSGGLGISGSTAGYVNMPWMQIYALQVAQ